MARKRKGTKWNYRDFYQDVMQIKLPSDFHVHHINERRGDNDLNNLVALPRELHERYHNLKNDIHFINGDFQLGAIPYYEINNIIDFFTCYRECMEWIDKRNYHAFEIGVSERPDMIVTKE